MPSPGCPNEIITPEIINKIHDIVLNDPKVKMREIAEIVSISTERVLSFVHEKALCKMGAAITHNRLKRCSIRTFPLVARRFKIINQNPR